MRSWSDEEQRSPHGTLLGTYFTSHEVAPGQARQRDLSELFGGLQATFEVDGI